MANAQASITHQPYVSAETSPHEFTWPAVLTGAILGIIFGASSLYLVLKVGLTVSASIPVAVLSITLFRAFSKTFGLRRATILENNIVQTTGSAGESIAFGVGLTMPAALLLGFDIDIIRVMTVGVLGGLLGILMMIPLRRAFIVKQHGQLTYPEGTACADVLIAGEKGGGTAQMVFLGFGIGFIYQFCMKALNLWKEEAEQALYAKTAEGTTVGLKGAVLGAELSPALLGVGYIIGPRIACVMVAGGVLAYLVLVPMIVFFGDSLTQPVLPAISKIDDKTGQDVGLIANMSVSQIRNNYILYIGAGAVAAGGIISMFYALPVIVASMRAGWRDYTAERAAARSGSTMQLPRTERDLSMQVVLFGTLGLTFLIALAPNLGLGLSFTGLVGSAMIVLFGFLFVTVSSRLTGEIGSSSNPISGMMVATLLLTCLLFLVLEAFGAIEINKYTKLTVLTIASVVCIASSNGGTTSQALKTGYLVGATPRSQQFAILIGSLTSALVIGVTLLLINEANTVYTKRNLPTQKIDVTQLRDKDHVRSGPYADDPNEYYVLNVGRGEKGATVPPGRYLVDDSGTIVYLVDPAVNGTVKETDDGKKVAKYDAPKTVLIQLIIDGVLDRALPWDLVLIGVLIAVTLELTGVPSLPFAVGVYLPLSASMPIFLGGMVRWLVDRIKPKPRSEAESDMSPGVLLSSGYIAGGSIAALLVAFFNFYSPLVDALNIGPVLLGEAWLESNVPPLVVFALMCLVLIVVGSERWGRSNATNSAATA